MPCYKCSNGKYKMGEGKCQYTSKENCEKALKAYKAKEQKNGSRR